MKEYSWLILVFISEIKPAYAAYNPSQAVTYANQWYASDVEGDGKVNHYNNLGAIHGGTGRFKFQYLDDNFNPDSNVGDDTILTQEGEDCTNFVSQALMSGGIFPHCSSDIRDCHLGEGRTFIAVRNLEAFLRKIVKPIAFTSAATAPQGLGPGDVVEWDHGHMTFVVAGAGANSILAAHTNFHCSHPASLGCNELDRNNIALQEKFADSHKIGYAFLLSAAGNGIRGSLDTTPPSIIVQSNGQVVPNGGSVGQTITVHVSGSGIAPNALEITKGGTIYDRETNLANGTASYIFADPTSCSPSYSCVVDLSSLKSGDPVFVQAFDEAGDVTTEQFNIAPLQVTLNDLTGSTALGAMGQPVVISSWNFTASNAAPNDVWLVGTPQVQVSGALQSATLYVNGKQVWVGSYPAGTPGITQPFQGFDDGLYNFVATDQNNDPPLSVSFYVEHTDPDVFIDDIQISPPLTDEEITPFEDGFSITGQTTESSLSYAITTTFLGGTSGLAQTWILDEKHQMLAAPDADFGVDDYTHPYSEPLSPDPGADVTAVDVAGIHQGPFWRQGYAFVNADNFSGDIIVDVFDDQVEDDPTPVINTKALSFVSPGTAATVSVSLSNITNDGNTTTTAAEQLPPPGYTLLPAAATYRVATAATFSTATVTMTYDPSLLSAREQSEARLLYFPGNGTYSDITQSQSAGSVMGQTTALGVFMIALSTSTAAGGGGTVANNGSALSLASDSSGNLWEAVENTSNGISLGEFTSTGGFTNAVTLPGAALASDWKVAVSTSGIAYAVGTTTGPTGNQVAVYAVSSAEVLLASATWNPPLSGGANPSGAIIDSSGTLRITGNLPSSATGAGYALGLWAYNPATELISLTTTYAAGNGFDIGSALQEDPYGNLWVLGYSSGTAVSSDQLALALWKFNLAGTALSSGPVLLPGFLQNPDDRLSAALLVSSGSIYAAAGRQNPQGDTDLSFIQFSSVGVEGYEQNWHSAGGGDEIARGLLLGGDGNLRIVGETRNNDADRLALWTYQADGTFVSALTISGAAGGNGITNSAGNIWLSAANNVQPFNPSGTTPLVGGQGMDMPALTLGTQGGGRALAADSSGDLYEVVEQGDQPLTGLILKRT